MPKEKEDINHENDKQQSSDQDEKEDYKEKYIRLLAEFDNYKKFKEKETQQLQSIMTKEIILDIIPVLEELEHAKENLKDKGITLIYNKLKKVLEKYGLKEISISPGDEFDHNVHDAVLYINSDLPEGKIVEVVKKGYILNNVIIRHPQVVVSNGNHKNNLKDKNLKEKDKSGEKNEDN